MEEEKILEIYEQKRARIQEFNLTSDLFAGKVFEDLTACQELCRILMQDSGLRLKDVKTQYVIRNLETHSVQLDIMAEEIYGSLVNIELQMYDEEEPLRRTRYYMSCIDVNILEKGKDYCELPVVAMVYITKADIIGGGKGLYQIERRVRGNGQVIEANAENGFSERYFNLRYPTADEKINELLTYMQNSDPFYQTENFPGIVKRVNYFKIQRGGLDIMCEIADRIKQEGKIEGKIEDILELLEELGKIPVKIVQHIKQEKDLKVLARWLRCAATASSISEFAAKM